LRHYYEDWIDTLAELRADVEEIIYEADDRVAAVIQNAGRGRVSGVANARTLLRRLHRQRRPDRCWT
jgi:hypothetical protein